VDDAGTPRPGIREVAERAGVARSSVSRVMNDHIDVSPAMRERVNAAISELGYRPDVLARGLRTGTTFCVGLVISDPMFAPAIARAERALRLAGYSVLLTTSDGRAELDRENIRLLLRRRVDGLILALTEDQDPGTVRLLREADTPIVLLDGDMPHGTGVSRVVFDHRSGMTHATDHLLDLGHRRIALIVGGPQRPAHERRDAVLAAIATGGASCSGAVHGGELSDAFGEQAMLAILEAATATAVIAGGDLLMQGALRACRAHGVRVGVDLSFVGCDDEAVAEAHSPPIAVVRRDVASVGATAVQLLLELIEDAAASREVILPTEFVRRASCGPPRPTTRTGTRARRTARTSP
jgi:LacI family transcriptional regulator